MASFSNLFPSREPVVDKDGLLTQRWNVYFRDRDQVINSNPSQAATPVTVQGQNASIGTTPIPAASLASGIYRVTYSSQITTAAAVSSSVAVSLFWTNAGNTQTFVGAALTTNTVNSSKSDTQLIQIDGATPVSYGTIYASNPAGAMHYTLAVVLEAIA